MASVTVWKGLELGNQQPRSYVSSRWWDIDQVQRLSGNGVGVKWPPSIERDTTEECLYGVMTIHLTYASLRRTIRGRWYSLLPDWINNRLMGWKHPAGVFAHRAIERNGYRWTTGRKYFASHRISYLLTLRNLLDKALKTLLKRSLTKAIGIRVQRLTKKLIWKSINIRWKSMVKLT